MLCICHILKERMRVLNAVILQNIQEDAHSVLDVGGVNAVKPKTEEKQMAYIFIKKGVIKDLKRNGNWQNFKVVEPDGLMKYASIYLTETDASMVLQEGDIVSCNGKERKSEYTDKEGEKKTSIQMVINPLDIAVHAHTTQEVPF